MLHLARHSAFTPQDLQKMMGFSVGFDSIFDRFFDMDLTRDSGYPPYNIRKDNELQYSIEVALAGFSKDDIEVEVTDGSLTIRSKPEDKKDVEKVDETFVHKGIAKRYFSRSFTIADYVEVKGAELKDGLLKVSLERIVPEGKKARSITIK